MLVVRVAGSSSASLVSASACSCSSDAFWLAGSFLSVSFDNPLSAAICFVSVITKELELRLALLEERCFRRLGVRVRVSGLLYALSQEMVSSVAVSAGSVSIAVVLVVIHTGIPRFASDNARSVWMMCFVSLLTGMAGVIVEWA